MDYLSIALGLSGRGRNLRSHFPLGPPVALDSRRPHSFQADPGYDTSTTLRSWRAAYGRRWEAVRERAAPSRRRGGARPQGLARDGIGISGPSSLRLD